MAAGQKKKPVKAPKKGHKNGSSEPYRISISLQLPFIRESMQSCS